LSVWLRAFFDCEGWVELEKGQNRRIGLDSANRMGLLQIQNKLKDAFGIDSIIKPRKKRKIFRLQIFGKENLIKFEKSIGFLHNTKRKMLRNAISSYSNHLWVFPKSTSKLKEFVASIMKERAKAKIREGEVVRIRIYSVIKNNLIRLSRALKKLYQIESKVFGPCFSGQGIEYYELSIHKISSVKKLLKNNLLNDKEKEKITLKLINNRYNLLGGYR
jgi:hypothetical protein